jgi:excisionase family DNA binding protein
MAGAELVDWLTLADAADRYGIKRDRLRRAALEGRLPAHKVGSGSRMPWLVRREDVERFLRESRPGRKRAPTDK